ncbi:transposable element Tcb1 transposase [Trichonephila clavipes]|nr:transposable element Tcb1 transposase [Trichonephila clavipes]
MRGIRRLPLIYDKSLCEELEISFEPPRRIRRKHIFGDGSKGVQLLYEDDLRRTMLSSIDRVTAEIRFNESTPVASLAILIALVHFVSSSTVEEDRALCIISRRKYRSAFDQVSEFDRGRIVAYRDCGLSFREIGSRVERNQTTVVRICDRSMEESITDRRGRSHLPQCTTSREDRQIVRIAVTDCSVTSRTIAQHIESVTHHSVSARTIRRRLQSFWQQVLCEVNDAQNYLQTEGLHIHQCAKKIRVLQTVLEAKREEFVDDALIYGKSLCEELKISFEPPRRIRRKHTLRNIENSDPRRKHRIEMKFNTHNDTDERFT